MPEGDNTPLSFVKDAFRFCWNRLANVLQITEMFPAAYEAAQDAYKNVDICFTIRSDKDLDYTGPIAQNAKADRSLTGLASNKIEIIQIKVQSDQNLDWQIVWWKSDAANYDGTDMDLNAWCGWNLLGAAAGEQIAGAAQYYYDSGIISKQYEDLDGTFELHQGVINRNLVSKVAGATGEIVVEVEYKPRA